MSRCCALTCALLVCAVTCASAQDPTADDTRTQYPAFLANSYFTFTVGSIGYLFSTTQLEPGVSAESIEKPRLAVRADLFGHHFTKYFSAQITYMRPIDYVKYRNVNGTGTIGRVSSAYAGLTFALSVPVSERVTLYGEGGGGITSRGGFTLDKEVAVQAAHYGAGMLGGGLVYHATPNVDWLVSATYSPGRKSFNQPSTRLYTSGIRYEMHPLPAATVQANRDAGFAFAANIARLGVTPQSMAYGVNDFFSRTIPIFWGGDVETRRGFTLDYERNVFHTKKVLAFDLGTSASYWVSNENRDSFRTLSAYPLFRFFVARTELADFYVCYSLAGPTFITRSELDGHDTGTRFTFQDFMGVGGFLGAARRVNLELGIKHFSNGNLFANNASVKVPLTLLLGLTF
jgi:lipid A 3-O-deacylase PagL